MMSRANALVLSALVLAVIAPALFAQKAPPGAAPTTVERPSHQRLGDGSENMSESALRDRIGTAQRLRNLKKLDPKQLAELTKLVESMRGKLGPDEIEHWKEKFRDGKVSTDDKDFRDLFDKIKGQVKDNPDLPPEDRDALNRWAKKLADGPNPVGNKIPPDGPVNGMEPMRPPLVQPPQGMPGPSPLQKNPSQTNDWVKGGLDGFVKHMDQLSKTSSGKSWAESMKNLAGRADAGRASTAQLGERTSALSRLIGQMSGRSPNIQPPRLGNPSMPNMPSLGNPSASFSGGSLAGAGSVLAVLLGLLLLALILWRGREWFSSLKEASRSAWKIGPWPVRPENVTTRGDLVRAFEYLALLCLGPTARTCHHLELGRRIGGQPALDAERRRESATALSRIYERARYTPDQEPLPGEDLRQARRELAYLAGAKG